MLGVCNGFQVLCEAGLLPGRAAAATRRGRFVCRDVDLAVETAVAVDRQAAPGRRLSIPVKHHDGGWFAATAQLDALVDRGQVLLRYDART